MIARAKATATAVAAAALACAVVLAPAAPARAHGRSTSYSSWQIDGREATVRLRVALLDLSALEGAVPGALPRADAPAPALADYLQRHLRLEDRGGERCAPVEGSFRSLSSARGWRRWEWRLACGGAPARVWADLLMDELPAHLHFARFEPANGAASERALEPEARMAAVPAASAAARDGWAGALARYVPLGVEHILGGWDHLVFLLALLLIARSVRETAVVVTGFTLGHSATLVLAALGTVAPHARAVEALIGLSIALVAVENVWLDGARRSARLPAAVVSTVVALAVAAHVAGGVPPLALGGVALFAACYFGMLARAREPRALRALVASLFGLVHGLGFAGVLGEMQIGPGEQVPALLGFNVGVELGQLAVVALVWPLLALIRRRGERPRRAVVHLGSAAAACAGTFWLVTRTFG